MKQKTYFILCIILCIIVLNTGADTLDLKLKMLLLLNTEQIEEIELSNYDVSNRLDSIRILKNNGFNFRTMKNCQDVYFEIIHNMINGNSKSVLIKQNYIKTKEHEWIPTNIPEIVKYLK